MLGYIMYTLGEPSCRHNYICKVFPTLRVKNPYTKCHTLPTDVWGFVIYDNP